MNYLTRAEIKEQLEAQFKEIRANIAAGNLNSDDVENLLFSEQDVCDNIEPNSANHMFARDMQHEFLNFEVRA